MKSSPSTDVWSRPGETATPGKEPMRNKLALVLVLGVVLFAVLIVQLNRYEIRIEDSVAVYRLDRLTGRVAIAEPGGEWQSIGKHRRDIFDEVAEGK